jgi:hypothetical protein
MVKERSMDMGVVGEFDRSGLVGVGLVYSFSEERKKETSNSI